MSITTDAKRRLAAIKSHIEELRAEGRHEEAWDVAFSALETFGDQNTDMALRLAALARERAGCRTERLDPAQLSLMIERVDLEGTPDEADDLQATLVLDEALDGELAHADAGTAAGEARRPRRRRLSPDLPRTEHAHELAPEERSCTCCGEVMAKIGEDVSEVLDLEPVRFRVHRHARAKYACSRCKETVVTAPGPPKLIERGLAGPGLLAHVVQSKYEDNIPLSRLVAIYRRGGVALATSTLSDWVADVAEQVTPIVERISEKALASETLQTDASGLKVLDRDHPEGVEKGTMWCIAGDRKYVVFRYAQTGSGEDGPWTFLKGRTGYIQADAASVFDRLYDGQAANATEVGCWAHARRKFFALADSDVRVGYPLKMIAQLYRLEELADKNGLSLEDRHEQRLTRAGPITERLWRWLTRTAAKEPPRSALAKACAYALNQWDALTQFLNDARLPMDNNFCERQIRSLALGRKNYLFAGSDAGAERAAVLYSLLRTAAVEKIDVYAYLIDVIEKIADGWPMSRIDGLLPENYTPAAAAPAATS